MHFEPAEAIYPCRCINMVKCAISMSGCRIGYKYSQLPWRRTTELKTVKEGVILHEETTKSLRLKHSCCAAPRGASTAAMVSLVFPAGKTWIIELSWVNLIENIKIIQVWSHKPFISVIWRSDTGSYQHRKITDLIGHLTELWVNINSHQYSLQLQRVSQ